MRGASRFRVGVIGLLAWGVLAFGGVYPWAYWPLFAGAASLGVWGIVATRAWHDPRMRGLAVAVAVLVAAASVQVIALPSRMVVALSPAIDRFFRAFEVGYHPADLRTLSLTPDATWANLAEIVCLGLLLIGLTRAIRHIGLGWLISQMMGLGVAMAVIGVVQKALSGTDHVRVYGFWQPRLGGNPFGPFINRNHFAGWIVMILPVVAAYAWGLIERSEPAEASDAPTWVRWGSSVEGNRVLLLATACGVMGLALVLTGSRTGIAAWGVAMAVLAVSGVLRARTRRRRLVAVTSLGALLLGALLWAGADLVIARFQRAPEELEGRLTAWRDTVRIVRDFPVFGVGLGGYGRAMLVYQSSGRQMMYAQAHDDYLQLLAEGGLLVVLPAVALAGVIIAGIGRRLSAEDEDPVTYWVRRGAVAGLLAIAAQSVMEFSLQMPGNAVTLVLLTAVALHRSRSLVHAYRV